VIRVLLVDDHPLFLDGVRAALGSEPSIEIVGEAPDVARALELATTTSPDEVLAAVPGARVLVMTMSTDDDAVVAAMRAGARGYVVKGTGRADLIDAVRTVAGGGAVFSPTVADRLGSFFSGLAAQPGRELFPQLSEREREVLELMARGYDNRRIARELFLSDKTVRNHVSSLLGKLEASDRADAILRARRAGMGEA
jgi:DNA-binding NarL/FixJ family response regulator